MATGRLGTADLSAATDTTVYTVPASTYAVATITICNRGTSPANIDIALADTGTPGNDEYIEYNTELLAKNVIERTGIVLEAGKLIVVKSSASSVNAVVVGIETAA
tara:strand:+ start:3482 stop:3799 length:318 start_codon:yes stop_codon:yes gene_type:complete